MTDTLTLIEPDPAKRLRVLVAGLRDYAENPTQHLLSDIESFADSLEAAANDLDQKLEQARRTVGGSQNKIRVQQGEIKALEGHLEAMEEETSELRTEVESLLNQIYGGMKTINEAREELGLKPWGHL